MYCGTSLGPNNTYIFLWMLISLMHTLQKIPIKCPYLVVGSYSRAIQYNTFAGHYVYKLDLYLYHYNMLFMSLLYNYIAVLMQTTCTMLTTLFDVSVQV